MTLKTVKCPEPFVPMFENAQAYVEEYFRSRKERPEDGTIEIGGERYILVRAASMSVHFLDYIKGMYPALDEREALEAASAVLFDMAHCIGMADARAFHAATKMHDPIAKLSTGPIHFAYTGWAFVDILADSSPTPDDDYLLVYDHPHSFEADAWLGTKSKVDFCTCFMNAGYSSGWCEESFGVRLEAREIFCRSQGDAHCRFVMAPPGRIEERVREYLARLAAAT
jgi:two-component system, cell cycle sensor histidine kinase and response regulator CckA